MMPLSTGLGWSVLGSLGRTRIDAGKVHRLWIVGPEVGLLLGWPAGTGVAFLYKNKKEEGSARASPVAAPMSKSISF